VKVHAAKHEKARVSMQIQSRLEGEVIGSWWSKVNSSKKPREVLRRLLKPGFDPLADTQAKYEIDSGKMATIARNYHNRIQKARRDTAPDIRDNAIQVVLQKVVRITTEEQAADKRTAH
jgi:hypothetical protein